MKNLSEVFLCKNLQNNSKLYYFNLNEILSPVDAVLHLSNLIKREQSNNKIVNIRFDKRKRAAGLFVLFSNDSESYKAYQNQVSERKKIISTWNLKNT